MAQYFVAETRNLWIPTELVERANKQAITRTDVLDLLKEMQPGDNLLVRCVPTSVAPTAEDKRRARVRLAAGLEDRHDQDAAMRACLADTDAAHLVRDGGDGRVLGI